MAETLSGTEQINISSKSAAINFALPGNRQRAENRELQWHISNNLSIVFINSIHCTAPSGSSHINGLPAHTALAMVAEPLTTIRTGINQSSPTGQTIFSNVSTIQRNQPFLYRTKDNLLSVSNEWKSHPHYKAKVCNNHLSGSCLLI